MQIELGSGILNQPSEREFDFYGFVYSGLPSFVSVGSGINRSDFNQLMGRRFTLPADETKKLIRDMVKEGYFDNGKFGIKLIKPMPAKKDSNGEQ